MLHIMTSALRYRPAIDTVLGVIAVAVASLWTFSVIQSTDAADSVVAVDERATSEAPAPRVNFTYVVGKAETLDKPFVEVASAHCPKGETVLGGGYWANDATVRIVLSRPTDELNAWEVGISNQPPFENIPNVKVAAYAMCAKPGKPVVLPDN